MLSSEVIQELDNFDETQIRKIIRDKSLYCWDERAKECELDEWLSNFSGKAFDIHYEKIIALMLLKNFVYFTYNEVVQLCKELYKKIRHDLIIQNLTMNDVEYYPIGNPSESGSMILYLFRSVNHIPKDHFFHSPISHINGKHIIFIDDIASSGSQATQHIKCTIKQHNISTSDTYYYCLFSTAKARQFFEINNLHIDSVYSVDDRVDILSENSYCEFSNELSQAVKEMLIKYNYINEYAPFGYFNSCLALGFFYNIPDNTLPIFWAKSNIWKPIFKRFGKEYGDIVEERQNEPKFV